MIGISTMVLQKIIKLYLLISLCRRFLPCHVWWLLRSSERPWACRRYLAQLCISSLVFLTWYVYFIGPDRVQWTRFINPDQLGHNSSLEVLCDTTASKAKHAQPSRWVLAGGLAQIYSSKYFPNMFPPWTVFETLIAAQCGGPSTWPEAWPGSYYDGHQRSDRSWFNTHI